jgi:SnoaL-like polyketide cyclase
VAFQNSFDRPLAAFVVNAVYGHPPALSAQSELPYLPPPTGRAQSEPLDHVIDGAHLLEVVRLLTKALLSDAATVAGLTEDIEAAVTSDVMAWSPRLYATSCAELIEALTELDDTVTDVAITIGGLDIVGSTVYVEWQATGRFSNPCLLGDDLLVEPTGRAVESAGVLIVRFSENRAAQIHCYYDDLALIEQLLTAA